MGIRVPTSLCSEIKQLSCAHLMVHEKIYIYIYIYETRAWTPNNVFLSMIVVESLSAPGDQQSWNPVYWQLGLGTLA